MTNQQILEKAIQKAIDGGWKGSPYLDYMKLAKDSYMTDMIMGNGVFLVTIVYSPPHDFAKAIWGEEMLMKANDTHPIAWQWHLRQMVIAEDPIQYLGDNS